MTKYCSSCGKPIYENTVICPNCGYVVAGAGDPLEDKPSIGLRILSFLFPIVGLVLFCVFLGSEPTSAKSYGLWGLVGCIAGCCAIMII